MKKLDLVLLASVFFLTIFGLFMIYDASSYVAFRDFADKYYYVKDQVFWILLGSLALVFFTNFNYKRFYNLLSYTNLKNGIVRC
jgi:cell division protein FtsW